MIDFLKALLRHIQRPLLIVWDRLPAHRSALVREFIALSQGHIETEYLPGYAPELNPVEYIWAYWKQHELPNVCPNDYWELDERARTTSGDRCFSSGLTNGVTSTLALCVFCTKTGLRRLNRSSRSSSSTRPA